tara:strand:- start:1998 stop:2201 length:204 start_codon:yes stop_codon:yes gene_type:complete
MKEESYINKWAVILGGSSGLGLATAKNSPKKGCIYVLYIEVGGLPWKIMKQRWMLSNQKEQRFLVSI